MRNLAARSPLAYRPPRVERPAGPLIGGTPGRSGFDVSLLQRAGALPAIALVGSLGLTCFLFSSPLVLCAAGAAVVIVGLASGAGAALALAARFAVPLALVMVAVNVIVSDRGETVLIRGLELPVLGSLDVTLESIAAGGVIALRVIVVIAAFAVMSRCVDPDAILRMVRPFARHSALTATLVGRLVPLAAADYMRLSEAAKLRGPAAAPAGRPALARRLVAGALDRSLDAAATLELRGYALPVVRQRAAPRRSRDTGLGFAAIAIAALAIAGRLAGLGSIQTYPAIEIGARAADLALATSILLIAAVPVAIAHRRRAGVRRLNGAAAAGRSGSV